LSLIFTATGDEAEDRRIRRLHAAGKLERIANGIYRAASGEPVEAELRRCWPRLVAKLVPDGIVTDRTGIETKPVQFTQGGPFNVYVSAMRSRSTIQLPGLSIHVRNGPGPLDGDIQYLGTHLAGQERRLLDNLTPSRARGGDGGPRTLGAAVVEAKLDEWCRTSGSESLNGIRDRAGKLAPLLGKEMEFDRLDRMIGTLLHTHQMRMLTPQGRARAAGYPMDVRCIERLAKLSAYMADRAPHFVPDRDATPERRMAGSFAEAYFSNFIEGINFDVEDAIEIAYEGKFPRDRQEDGHDIHATYLQLVDPVAHAPSATSYDEFKDEIRTRHGELMKRRPNLNPGRFKTRANHAGDTTFVSPDLVEGTMKEGHAMLRGIDDPFQRGVFVHYMMAEIHPFDDGNGRISRILMSRELMSSGLSRIVVPTVFRDDYLDAMRALSRRDDPSILVRSLEFCQRVSAACSANSSSDVIDVWASSYAFCEKPRHARLTMPNPALQITKRGGVFAPDDYWRSLDGDKNSNPFGMS
jgi:hypothetical protein